MQQKHFRLLHNALLHAQRFRNHLPDLGWIEYEKLTMLGCVNMARSVEDRFKDEKRPLVTMEQIEQAESLASGHVDYSKKFALYCAELIDA